MSVLITGGNGGTAQQLIEILLNHPECPPLRILVRHGGVEPLQETFPLLTHVPHSVIVTDYMDEASLTRACRGVSIVVYNGPSIHLYEAVMGMTVIEAAKNAGVGHFILCSVFQPLRSKLVTHKLKLQIEEYLVEARINYTILQPTHFMQNVPLGHALRTGNIPLGYSETVMQGFVDLRDVAHVIRNIILDPGQHNLATYELVGENMTYAEVAKILQEIMCQDVRCDTIPFKKYITMLEEGDIIRNEYTEDVTERIMIYHDRWGLIGNSNVLRWLLGRQPKTWKEYVIDMLRKS